MNTNFNREINKCVSIECINNVQVSEIGEKSKMNAFNALCVLFNAHCFSQAGTTEYLIVSISLNRFHCFFFLSSFYWFLITHYKECWWLLILFLSVCPFHPLSRQKNVYVPNYIHLSVWVVYIYLAAPPASGLVNPDTSTNMATGTMYIQYLAKKPRLSLTSPRSRASRSRSIFWMKLDVSGLRMETNQRTLLDDIFGVWPEIDGTPLTLVPIRIAWQTHRCWIPRAHLYRCRCLCCKRFHCPIPIAKCPARHPCNPLISIKYRLAANWPKRTETIGQKRWKLIEWIREIHRVIRWLNWPLLMKWEMLIWHHCDCASLPLSIDRIYRPRPTLWFGSVRLRSSVAGSIEMCQHLCSRPSHCRATWTHSDFVCPMRDINQCSAIHRIRELTEIMGEKINNWNMCKMETKIECRCDIIVRATFVHYLRLALKL